MMKKLFALFTALFLLCACGSLCVAAAELPFAVFGDVNSDGWINNKDLGQSQQSLNEDFEPSGGPLYNDSSFNPDSGRLNV